MNKITYLCFAMFIAFQSISHGNNFLEEKLVNSNSSSGTKIVKIKFTTPLGYQRYLSIGFTDRATDGFDYGYDSPIALLYQDDLNYLVEDYRCIIQGVGEFNDTKTYPFGMYITNEGEVKVELVSIENFESEIDVYIYDNIENTYTRINDGMFTKEMISGEYENRFYIAFRDLNEASNSEYKLSIEDKETNLASVKYLSKTKEIKVKGINSNSINNLKLYSITGQPILEKQYNKAFEASYNAQHLTTGVYIINIETNNGVYSKKLAIN